MKTVLYNEHNRRIVISKIEQCPADGSMVVTLEEKQDDRSLAQNKLMWKWFTEFGEVAGYTKQEAHDAFCEEILGMETYRTLSGELRERPNGTKDLKVKPFAEFLNQVDRIAAEMGCQLSHPEDLYYIAMGYTK